MKGAAMQQKRLRNRLIIIICTIFVLPCLVLCYILYEQRVTLSPINFVLFLLILTMVIIGIILIYHVFEAVSMTAEFLKKTTEDNKNLSLNLHQDVVELNEITSSANSLIVRLEKTTESLNQTIEELHESDEKFRNILENIEDGYYEVDLTGNFTLVNASMSQLLGYSREELKGMNNRQYMDKENLKRAFLTFSEVYKTGIPKVNLEGELIRKDGKKVFVEASVSLIKNSFEQSTGFRGIVHNITERKLAEKQLHASLREKELLIGEVHHRVKNNLQVISGLLDLQAASSGNPELMEMFHESQSRIRSMALIHEKLYDSKNFARIDLAGYVRGLSQELFQTYKISPGEIDLIIQTGGDVYVDINKAIPCGLILNELISNALKHAFSGDGAGAITVIIRKYDNKEIEIVVGDNGLGLPDDVDIRQPRSMGLHLVNGLVKNQLDGQIEVRRDNGTEFRIIFPL